jgi:putative PIN family toxin of toxin-antitoxin system
MRLVVDTNVLVSGSLTPFGAPGAIVSLIVAGRLRLCYDARMLAEYHDVLRRESFGFDEDDVGSFLAQIQSQGEMVVPMPLPVEFADEDDKPFLEVAVASGVDFLVTGNRRHYPEGDWDGVRIVTPREFLDHFVDTR